MRKKIIFMMMSMFLLCGCSGQAVTGDDAHTENTVSGGDVERDNCSRFLESYEEKYYDDRVKVSEYKEAYKAETEDLKNYETEKLSFKSCDFGAMEAQDDISVLRLRPHSLSVEESWKVMEDWLKEIGMKDFDMDKEVRDASGQFERDESNAYPYDYPSVREHYSDLKTGNGFFLNTNECYLQMGGDGIYSMSDGAITKYLKNDGFAAMDALGNNSETIVKEGKLKELEGETWELPSGKVSVGDAADAAKKYFEKGTPYPCADGVQVDIPKVSVFSLDNKYGYAFTVRRKYKGIPFAYTEGGGRNYYEGGYEICEDDKTAYVVDDKTVSAFTGYSEAQSLEPVGKAQDSIISLKEAVSILNEKLAMRINVDVSQAELSYCVVSNGDEAEEKDTPVIPCWLFDGVNRNNEQGMRMYLDAFTGELYYYTYYMAE